MLGFDKLSPNGGLLSPSGARGFDKLSPNGGLLGPSGARGFDRLSPNGGLLSPNGGLLGPDWRVMREGLIRGR